MPIYEYACPDCGYLNDHLQKLADAPIAACPKCGSTKYYKKISAAGFALKGTGWYVTDFRNGAQKPSDKKADGTVVPPPSGESKSSDNAPAKTDSAPAPAASTPAVPPPPAPSPSPASSDK